MTNGKIMALAAAVIALSGLPATIKFPATPAEAQSLGAVPATVEVDQLKEAGFTSSTVQAALPGKFLPPVFYFRVKETVTGEQGKAWGDAANMVSVLIQPVSDTSWVYNGGAMEEIDLSGRTQANLSSAGYFISVTGPDKQKVETLAHNLKVLY